MQFTPRQRLLSLVFTPSSELPHLVWATLPQPSFLPVNVSIPFPTNERWKEREFAPTPQTGRRMPEFYRERRLCTTTNIMASSTKIASAHARSPEDADRTTGRDWRSCAGTGGTFQLARAGARSFWSPDGQNAANLSSSQCARKIIRTTSTRTAKRPRALHCGKQNSQMPICGKETRPQAKNCVDALPMRYRPPVLKSFVYPGARPVLRLAYLSARSIKFASPEPNAARMQWLQKPRSQRVTLAGMAISRSSTV